MDRDWHGAKWWRKRAPSERVLNAQLPLRLRNASLDEWEGTKALKRYNAWRKAKQVNDGIGFLIKGRGARKFAAAIVIDLLGDPEINMCGYFTSAQEIVKMAFATMDEGGNLLPETYPSPHLYRMLWEWDLLVIEGLGDEQPGVYSMTTLSNILTSRFDAMKPTIITLNSLSGNALEERYQPLVYTEVIPDGMIVIDLEEQ
jgi:hypothetical protein